MVVSFSGRKLQMILSNLFVVENERKLRFKAWFIVLKMSRHMKYD